MLKRTEMQFKTRSKLVETQKGQALTFGFCLGPVTLFVIANLPEKNGNPNGPLVYVKMDIREDRIWKDLTKLPRRTEMQFKTRSKPTIIQGEKALLLDFRFGPILVSVVSYLSDTLVDIRMNFGVDEIWQDCFDNVPQNSTELSKRNGNW